jgi:hypothetical protein
MNALAAKDIEAADLLAQLDGDNSPGRSGPAWSHPGRPVPDMIAIAREPKDPRPLPETSGGHSAVARSPAHPPVTASRAE